MPCRSRRNDHHHRLRHARPAGLKAIRRNARRSIAFDEMSEDEFQQLVRAIFALIARRYWPQLDASGGGIGAHGDGSMNQVLCKGGMHYVPQSAIVEHRTGD